MGSYISINELTSPAFIERLASKAPVPGGGGTAALVAALGVALGNMVGSLTLGKAKYATVQDEIVTLKQQSDDLQNELLKLVDADAEAFVPLSEAYGLPTNTDEQRAQKTEILERCLVVCCEVPLRIMQACARAIVVLERFGQIGARIAISDAGVGAVLCQAALKAASLNVFINTRLMTDTEQASGYNAKAESLLAEYLPRAEAAYEGVLLQLLPQD
ncbi:MAG: cyclodeaminase/cyclohydrolase family protein [Coriobacteriales bacterium]|jgi:formiminotetrahydrofolate cyclodeaminase|nr:cyclodeaminase/cyclohydrolase family protein [Coriobacteriales bacterium]